jgi:phosphoglucomutase
LLKFLESKAMEEVTKNVQAWLQNGYDEDTKNTIRNWHEAMSYDHLEEAFGTSLSWGSGGIRAKDGIGTSRINKYTIATISLAFMRVLQQQWGSDVCLRIAIAYDNRSDSSYYAQVAAQLFSTYGMEVKLFDVLSPLPMLSFAIRHYSCHGGIMITGGHNSASYNGLKLLDEAGAELSTAGGEAVIGEMNNIQGLDEFQQKPNLQAISFVSEEIEQAYAQYLASHLLFESIKPGRLKMMYSPWQGSGCIPVLAVLEQQGFSNLVIEDDHFMPTPYFDDMPGADPTAPDALKPLFQNADAKGVDLIVATSSDCSRVAIAARDARGKLRQFSGHQLAALAVDHVLTQYRRNGLLTSRHLVMKSIPTSSLVKSIVHSAGLSCLNVPVGLPSEALLAQPGVLMAVEETGSIILPHLGTVKDGILYAAIIGRLANELHLLGCTLWDKLEMLHLQYGLHVEKTHRIDFGKYASRSRVQAYLDNLKASASKQLQNELVVKVRDLHSGEVLLPISGELDYENHRESLPMLLFQLTDGIEVYVRASQTAAAVKLYASSYSHIHDRSDWKTCQEEQANKLERILQMFKTIAFQ